MPERPRIAERLTEADWRAAPSSARIRQRVGLSNLPEDWRPRDLGKRVSMPVGELLAHFGRRSLTDYRGGVVCLLRKLTTTDMTPTVARRPTPGVQKPRPRRRGLQSAVTLRRL
jgi:hypothetical protein